MYTIQCKRPICVPVGRVPSGIENFYYISALYSYTLCGKGIQDNCMGGEDKFQNEPEA